MEEAYDHGRKSKNKHKHVSTEKSSTRRISFWSITLKLNEFQRSAMLQTAQAHI